MNTILNKNLHTFINMFMLALVVVMPNSVPTQSIHPVANEIGSPSSPIELLQFSAAGHVIGFSKKAVYTAAGDHMLRVEFLNTEGVVPLVYQSVEGSKDQIQPLGTVTYPDLWKGITLRYSAASGSILESAYQLAPGADVSQIRLHYNVPVEVNADGSLSIAFETGTMTESTPIAWQEIDGQRMMVDVAFEKLGEQKVGFALGFYDLAYPLMIDPTLVWNTFLGSSGIDSGYCIALDESGNVYLAGRSEDSWGNPLNSHSGSSDSFIAKLNSSGALQWNTFMGGPGFDGSYSITLDGSENIIISGWGDATWGSPVAAYTGGNDVFVAKLNSSGALQWNTFMGSSGDDRHWSGLTTDASGNIYISGSSAATWGSPVVSHAGGWDAFSAKLNSNGVLQWNTFLGSSSDGDYGTDIALDGDGNVFVGGGSEATWGDPIVAYAGGGDAFVAKLNSSGAFQWNTFMGGTGYDYGSGITLDDSGNIYAAGESDVTWGSPVLAHAGGWDFYAAKLDSSGVLQWNTFMGSSGDDHAHNGASIAVDSSGNTYVIGISEANWGSPVVAYTAPHNDVFVAELNSSGALQWNTFMGSQYNDSGLAIAVDGSGNSHIVGASWWSNWGSSPINELAGAQDAFAAKLNGSGALQWNTFLGASGFDGGFGIAADDSGNVYVTGRSDATWGSPVNIHTGGYDAFVAKLNNSGVLQWNTFLGSSGFDESNNIVLDSNGNIYVSGSSNSGWGSPVAAHTGGYDGFIAKLNSSGVLEWNTFVGSANDDFAWSLSLDNTGDLYLSGDSNATWGSSPIVPHAGGKDAFVAKFDNSGVLQWNTFLGSSADEWGYDIIYDSGDVFLLGFGYDDWGTPLNTYVGGGDSFVAKLSNNGVLQWHTFMGGTGKDFGNGITVDRSGNLYVMGDSDTSWGSPVNAYVGGNDVFVVKLNSIGAQIWNTFMGSAGDDYGYRTGTIVVDTYGKVFITGRSEASWGSPVISHSGGSDAFVAELNNYGALQWNTFLGSDDYDRGNAIAVDDSGNLYVTGYSWVTWGSPVNEITFGGDVFVSKLNIGSALTPTIKVEPNHGWVRGNEWPVGAAVTVTVDDDADLGNGWLYQETKTAQPDEDNPSAGFVHFSPSVDMSPGQYIIMEDGTTTKEHTIYDLVYDYVDETTDIAYGSGPANRPAKVFLRTGVASKTLDINTGTGAWSADFGAVPFVTSDTQNSHITAFDDEGDATMVHLPWRWLAVVPSESMVYGEHFAGDSVTLIIDDDDPGNGLLYTATQNVGDELCYPCFDLEGVFTLETNQFVSLVDEIDIPSSEWEHTTETVQVAPLVITNVDVDADTISGTSTPYANVTVNIESRGEVRYIQADSGGLWIADFSSAGDVIQPGDYGYATQHTAYSIYGDLGYGSGTRENWEVALTPTIKVEPNHGWVRGNEWPVGAAVTLTVDDDSDLGNGWLYRETKMAQPDGDNPSAGFVNFSPSVDLSPGQTITMEDGTTTKEHVIYNLVYDYVDETTDIAYGSGPANRPAKVFLRTGVASKTLDINTGTGDWVADFGAVPFETSDTQNSHITAFDDEGDATMVHLPWRWVTVVPSESMVYGEHWAGDSVTLKIADKNDPGNVLYTTTQSSGDAPCSPCFDLEGIFTLETGQYVSLVDEIGLSPSELEHVTETVQVAPLTITDVDIGADTISGTGDIDAYVAVGIESQGVVRYVQVGSGGTWTADFSVGNAVADIQPGDYGHATQHTSYSIYGDIGYGSGTREYWSESTGTISGTIYQDDGTTAIPNVAVSLLAGTEEVMQACTDTNGNFSFDFVAFGIGWRVSAVPEWRCFGQPEGYVHEYWQNTHSWEAATVIELSGSQPTYDSIVFTLDQGETTSGVVGVGGGTVSTPGNTVNLAIPANSISSNIAFTITDGGSQYQVTTDQGAQDVILSTTIGPEGTTFTEPATLTFQWPDADDNGIVDGTSIEESSLFFSKDGVMFAGPCVSDVTHCDMVANEFTVQVSSLSKFVIGPASISMTILSQGKYDGWIRESSETSGKGGAKNSMSKVFYVGDDAYNRQYRSILSFNTSAIPDDAVITSVKLKVKKAGLVGKSPFRTHKGLRVDIRKGKFGTSPKLQLSDFQAKASKNLVGKFSSKAVSKWYTANLGSAAYTRINKTGTTQFRLRFYKDDNNDFGADYFKFYSGNAGSASRPQLIVDYYVP